MKQTKFKSVALSGALCVGLLGAGTRSASAVTVQGSDGGGVQMSDFSGTQGSDAAAGLSLAMFNSTSGGGGGGAIGGNAFTQNPQAFTASLGAALGRFGVSAQQLLLLLNSLKSAKLTEPGKSPLADTRWYYQANAATAPAMAAKPAYETAALLAAAQRVAASGLKLSEVLGSLANERKQVNFLVVGPANKAARSLRSALGDFVMELQKVPTKNLTPEQLRSLNQVVEDTATLTASLESVAPVLSDMSKKMNAGSR